METQKNHNNNNIDSSNPIQSTQLNLDKEIISNNNHNNNIVCDTEPKQIVEKEHHLDQPNHNDSNSINNHDKLPENQVSNTQINAIGNSNCPSSSNSQQIHLTQQPNSNEQTNLKVNSSNQTESIPEEKKDSLEEKKETEKKVFNQEYFDEFNRPKYEDIIQYENQIRQEIENNSPLVSDKLPIDYLLKEFKNTIFEGAVCDVMKKYAFIRTVRRDGNFILIKETAFIDPIFSDFSKKWH